MYHLRSALLVLILLAGALCAAGCGDDATVDSRYEVLDQVDAAALAEVRRIWPDAGRLQYLHGEERETARRALALTVEQHPLALLKLLTERKPSGSVSTGWPYGDEEQEATGWLLAARCDVALNPVLLAMVEDEDLHVESRRTAAIALAWPGNDAALGPLVDRVLDTGEATDLRTQILYRLPRFERPLPDRLKELLHRPFRGLDRLAAAALAGTGDLEAPSLLLEILSEPVGMGDLSSHVFALDALGVVFEAEEDRAAVAGSREALVHPAPISMSVRKEKEPGRPEWREEMEKRYAERGREQTEKLSALARRFSRWLGEDESRTASRYESLRREYFAGDRRARELELGSLPDLLEISGDPPDFAAAALILGGESDEARERILWRLTLLGRAVRERGAAAGDGPARLAALDACLLPRRIRSMRYSDYEPGGSSFLPGIFDEHHGSPLGLVNLYLSVADRAEIPLYAVLASDLPRVRYREGEQVWELDPAAGPEPHTFATAAWKPVPPEDADREPLSIRQVLSILRSRQAELVRRQGSIRLSRLIAGTAIHLWERNGQAHRTRLLATYALDPDSDATVLASLGIVAEYPLFGGTADVDVANLLLGLELWEEAHRAYSALLREHPKLRAATAMAASCLTMMGRAKEARETLDELLREEPGNPGYRGLRLQALVALRDSAWRKELAAVEDPVFDPTLHLVAATALLTEFPGAPSAPESALEVLDEIAGLAEQTLSDRRDTGLMTTEEMEEFKRTPHPADPLADAAAFRGAQRSYFLLRADALRQTGDRAAALEAFRRAEALGDADRDLLRLRKKLHPK